jgi:hypothetical protein
MLSEVDLNHRPYAAQPGPGESLMPQQETFLNHETGDGSIQVLKTYDRAFAREAFDQMSEPALRFLHGLLFADDATDDANDKAVDSEFSETLWSEIEDGAREDWRTFSYFVVVEQKKQHSEPLFVASDWPSAERFAMSRIAMRDG